MNTKFSRRLMVAVAACMILLTHTSCSEDEPEVNPAEGMVKVGEAYALGAATKIEIWSTNSLTVGYNPVFFALIDSTNNSYITDADMSIYPHMGSGMHAHSCPFENPSVGDDKLFSGAVMFSMPSHHSHPWNLHVTVNRSGQGVAEAHIPVMVTEQGAPSMSSFTEGNDTYYIACHFTDGMEVGENAVQFIVFKGDGHSFVPVENLSIRMTPEMPSMNHGSPNNVDPVHTEGGHYLGKVNFTMTGEWRLNLDISDNNSLSVSQHIDVILK